MSLIDILAVVGILIIVLVLAGWRIIANFDNIESDETDPHDHIKEDVHLDEHK